MASPYTLYIARMIRNDVLNIGPFTDMSGTATELSTGRRTVIRMTEAQFNNEIVGKGDLCNMSVNPNYIKRQVPKNDTFFLMFYYPKTPLARLNKPFEISLTLIRPVGFIMARTDLGAEDLYIDVICSIGKSGPFKEHSGTLLLEEAVTVARRQRLRSISLSSLPHVLAYYRKFQFAHRKSCDREPNVDFTNALQIRMKDPANPLPKTPDQAFRDEDMLNYMTLLHERGYGHGYETRDCALDAAGKIKKDKFRSGRCGNDGFKMKRCLAF